MARTPKKTLILEEYIKTHPGEIVTVQKLATIADCTIQNVYVYIRNNQNRFNALGKGEYTILSMSDDTTYLTNSVEL
jgi:hypothetical protein